MPYIDVPFLGVFLHFRIYECLEPIFCCSALRQMLLLFEFNTTDLYLDAIYLSFNDHVKHGAYFVVL